MYTYHSRSSRILDYLSRSRPAAIARICGTVNYPTVCGTLMLFESHAGVFAVVSVGGLPRESGCGSVLEMHIYDPSTGKHLGKKQAEHSHHSGDFPPLFVERADAWCAFLTQRINVADVLEKTIVIHARADDFTSRSSGDSGEKIACGTITAVC